MDGSGFVGSAVRDGKGVVGQARFREVKNVAQTAGNISTIFMAMAVMSINESLKDIAETQKSILSFLEVDKQTQMKGDLISLTDILEEYGHNWDNAQYLSNREMQVLDIKRSSEQNILFYREMIEKKFAKPQFIRMDTSKALADIQNQFKYYQLALYLYSFSSFLDIMLLKNFSSGYLQSISEKVRRYADEYDVFYEKSLNDITKLASSSVQSRALQGLSIAGKFVGKQIGKIPDKENKIKIDDLLLSGGEKLEELQHKSQEETKKSFTVVQDNGIRLFIDKIDLMETMYNEPLKIAFDKENLYLMA